LITYRPIEHIQPSSKNPRLHSEKQVQQIAHSIKTFGFNVPLLVNEHGQLIAGHGRWLAAPLLGLKEVPPARRSIMGSTFWDLIA
jgi:ParB-like chromosome segregation protein Spo0J